MERECPFWAQQRLCNNDKCAICECEDEEIPDFWKAQQSKAQPAFFSHEITKQPNIAHGLAGKGFNRNAFEVHDCPQSCHEWCIDDVLDEAQECQDSIFVNL